MAFLPTSRRSIEEALSAYADGELDPNTMATVAEHLVFRSELGDRLRAYEGLNRLASSALAPTSPPDPAAAAQAVVQRVQAAAAAARPAPQPARRPLYRRPVFLASLGLVVTAGLTLVELRRRRLV